MKNKKMITSSILMALVLILTMIVRVSGHEERVEKEETKEKLNELYEFSIPEEKDIIDELEPEISELTIMYFHLLSNEVDEDTFFKLKEETVDTLMTVRHEGVSK